MNKQAAREIEQNFAEARLNASLAIPAYRRPPITAGLAQECASAPVTVGRLPKLDTDPYFQVAKTGAEEAAKEIGGTVVQ